ncbi:hypothetical protein HJC99_00965 [Candidatus Saccharibacteria bacterium]|nr:hypothetical protein [Candidatus Saccharibacteria bacterium]
MVCPDYERRTMPSYQLSIVCGAPRAHQYFHAHFGDVLALESITEPTLRLILTTELARYREVYGCSNPRGWLQPQQDLPDLKIRRGTTIVSSSEPGFPPDAEICAHCGWQSFGGRNLYESADRNLHYCMEPECLKLVTARHKRSQRERGRQKSPIISAFTNPHGQGRATSLLQMARSFVPSIKANTAS